MAIASSSSMGIKHLETIGGAEGPMPGPEDTVTVTMLWREYNADHKPQR